MQAMLLDAAGLPLRLAEMQIPMPGFHMHCCGGSAQYVLLPI